MWLLCRIDFDVRMRILDKLQLRVWWCAANAPLRLRDESMKNEEHSVRGATSPHIDPSEAWTEQKPRKVCTHRQWHASTCTCANQHTNPLLQWDFCGNFAGHNVWSKCWQTLAEKCGFFCVVVLSLCNAHNISLHFCLILDAMHSGTASFSDCLTCWIFGGKCDCMCHLWQIRFLLTFSVVLAVFCDCSKHVMFVISKIWWQHQTNQNSELVIHGKTTKQIHSRRWLRSPVGENRCFLGSRMWWSSGRDFRMGRSRTFANAKGHPNSHFDCRVRLSGILLGNKSKAAVGQTDTKIVLKHN